MYPQIYTILPKNLTEAISHLSKLYPTGINYGFWATNSNVNSYPLDVHSWSKLSPIGIAAIFMWLLSLVLSVIIITAVRRAKYVIGKDDRLIFQLVPINLSIAFVVIIGLISQPGLIHIPFDNKQSSFNLMSKYPNPVEAANAHSLIGDVTKSLVGNNPDVKSLLDNHATTKVLSDVKVNPDLNLAYLNFKNYTVAGYVFFAITLIIAISIFVHALIFLFKVIFYKTREKSEVVTTK